MARALLPSPIPYFATDMPKGACMCLCAYVHMSNEINMLKIGLLVPLSVVRCPLSVLGALNPHFREKGQPGGGPQVPRSQAPQEAPREASL